MRESQRIPNGGETVVLDNQYLISKTDLDGRVVYANPAFIEISGFTREELLGQHHNIVRHPEMPREVFKNFWETIKNGRSWSGIVKNKTKNGGFYWVHASVSPIIEAGNIKGYASVRVKPSSQQISDAQSLYSKISLNRLSGYKLSSGKLLPTGWRRALSLLKVPFSARLVVRTIRSLLIGMAGGAGLTYLLLKGDVSPYVVGPLGALLAVGGSFYIRGLIRGLTRPVLNAALVAQQIASGNLLVDIGEGSSNSDEIRHLYFNLGLMRQSLNAIAIDSLAGTQSTKQIALALSQDNNSLADRAQEQSAAIQETAASMEELTVTVQQNADNAIEAAALSNQSLATVKEGGEAVNSMVVTMQGIQKSSNQIAEIVNLIEGIAFQTNILALNAAVESARAGDAGRGFAVVASEVRSLAQRSSQAAGEIKALIEKSESEIGEGVKQAALTGTSMAEITNDVEKVNHIIGEISSASGEQSTGLSQIYQAISLMEGATQQNSDLAAHLNDTVNELSYQTELLEESMRVLVT